MGHAKPEAIRFGPLPAATAHLCVDVQRLFCEATPWFTPWMQRILPNVDRLASARPQQTIFTRFIPARRSDECVNGWRRYYQRWPAMTLNNLEPSLIELCSPLQRHAPPARIVDKATYSPWLTPALSMILAEGRSDTLIISGGETDVCVLATVLGAVDRSYRVIIAVDAICSSADETHDALMTLYSSRFSEQIEIASTAEILECWEGV